jgi:hypothetical protein
MSAREAYCIVFASKPEGSLAADPVGLVRRKRGRRRRGGSCDSAQDDEVGRADDAFLGGVKVFVKGVEGQVPGGKQAPVILRAVAG